MRSRSTIIIFVLLLVAGLSLPAIAAEEGATPTATEENSMLSTFLGMLEGLTPSAEAEASPFEPPGFGGTPPGQGGTPPGQTNPPGHGGTPPGQSGDIPEPPGLDGMPPHGHAEE